MYNTGCVKSRRALDCFFTFMAEILQGYCQILDRSGKKIILLSPLVMTEQNQSLQWLCGLHLGRNVPGKVAHMKHSVQRDKRRQTSFNEFLGDFVMKKTRTKPFQQFAGICSALIDSTIVAFCKYFNNDSIREVYTSPVETGVHW